MNVKYLNTNWISWWKRPFNLLHQDIAVRSCSLFHSYFFSPSTWITQLKSTFLNNIKYFTQHYHHSQRFLCTQSYSSPYNITIQRDLGQPPKTGVRKTNVNGSITQQPSSTKLENLTTIFYTAVYMKFNHSYSSHLQHFFLQYTVYTHLKVVNV